MKAKRIIAALASLAIVSSMSIYITSVSADSIDGVDGVDSVDSVDDVDSTDGVDSTDSTDEVDSIDDIDIIGGADGADSIDIIGGIDTIDAVDTPDETTNTSSNEEVPVDTSLNCEFVDINNDGFIDDTDIQILNDYILGKDINNLYDNANSGIDINTADVNEDGVIDVFDLAILKDFVIKHGRIVDRAVSAETKDYSVYTDDTSTFSSTPINDSYSVPTELQSDEMPFYLVGSSGLIKPLTQNDNVFTGQTEQNTLVEIDDYWLKLNNTIFGYSGHGLSNIDNIQLGYRETDDNNVLNFCVVVGLDNLENGNSFKTTNVNSYMAFISRFVTELSNGQYSRQFIGKELNIIGYKLVDKSKFEIVNVATIKIKEPWEYSPLEIYSTCLKIFGNEVLDSYFSEIVSNSENINSADWITENNIKFAYGKTYSGKQLVASLYDTGNEGATGYGRKWITRYFNQGNLTSKIAEDGNRVYKETYNTVLVMPYGNASTQTPANTNCLVAYGQNILDIYNEVEKVNMQGRLDLPYSRELFTKRLATSIYETYNGLERTKYTSILENVSPLENAKCSVLTDDISKICVIFETTLTGGNANLADFAMFIDLEQKAIYIITVDCDGPTGFSGKCEIEGYNLHDLTSHFRNDMKAKITEKNTGELSDIELRNELNNILTEEKQYFYDTCGTEELGNPFNTYMFLYRDVANDYSEDADPEQRYMFTGVYQNVLY